MPKTLAFIATSAVALLAGASVASAATTTLIEGDIFFGAGTPTSAYSGVNELIQFSFDVPSSFSGSSTSDITDFTYTVNGKAVSATPSAINFFPVTSQGMFDIVFPTANVSIYGADIGSSGTVGPTGGYDVTAALNDANPATGAGFVDLTVAAVPEPSVWALMIAGIGMLGMALRVGRGRRSLGLTTA